MKTEFFIVSCPIDARCSMHFSPMAKLDPSRPAFHPLFCSAPPSFQPRLRFARTQINLATFVPKPTLPFHWNHDGRALGPGPGFSSQITVHLGVCGLGFSEIWLMALECPRIHSDLEWPCSLSTPRFHTPMHPRLRATEVSHTR